MEFRRKPPSANGAAKHAVAGFTDSLRCELIHQKSRVHLTMMQLPALNTPQFEWLKSRLPRKAQLVPPSFQAEGAARFTGRRTTAAGKSWWGLSRWPPFWDRSLLPVSSTATWAKPDKNPALRITLTDRGSLAGARRGRARGNYSLSELLRSRAEKEPVAFLAQDAA